MKKRLFAFIFMAVLVFCGQINIFAQEYTLTLNDAIEMATKDSPQFISADTKIMNAQKQLDKAKKDQRDVKGVIRLPDGLSLAAVKKGYYVEQAKVSLETAKMEKTQAQNKLAYEVTEKYYTVKLAEKLYSNAENTYNTALENKNYADTQFSLGLLAEIDVNKADYTLMQAENARDTYKRNLDIARKNLLISLQLDENSSLVLTDTIEYEAFSADVKKDSDAAMETRLDVYSLKMAAELSEKYRDVTSLLGEKSPEYSAANQSLVQSEYTYTNSKKLIALSIYSSYNAILNADDSLKLAEKKLSVCQQEYNIAKLQTELGMITNSQLTASLNAVAAAQTELENAKLTYKLAVKKYGYEITLGL